MCALGFPLFEFIFATPVSMQRISGLPATYMYIKWREAVAHAYYA